MSNDSWLTPPEVLDPIREFYGGAIDLDPFHNPNSYVAATRYYTEEQDGFVQPWVGNVFANPPYSKPNLAKTGAKCRLSLDAQICLLVPADTSTDWFHQYLFRSANAILFYKKRIRFLDPITRKPTGSPKFPSVLAYWGDDPPRFHEHFESEAKLGEVIVMRWR